LLILRVQDKSELYTTPPKPNSSSK